MTTMGHATRFGLGPQHASNLATREFEFQSCTLDKGDTQLILPGGIRGQRAPIGDYAQKNIYSPAGSVTIFPRPDDLDFLLPYILGAAEDTDVFDLAETLPELVATIDYSLYVQTYRSLKVAQAIFRSSQGQPLALELQLAGKTADTKAAAASFPDIASTLSEKLPYVHHQATWTFSSTSVKINNLVLTIDNGLELDHHNNSQTRTDIPEGEQTITLGFNTEHDSFFNTGLLDIAAAGVSAADLEYTDGTDTLTIAFGLLQKPQTPNPIQGKASLRPQVTLQAYEDLANTLPMIKITNTNN